MGRPQLLLDHLRTSTAAEVTSLHVAHEFGPSSSSWLCLTESLQASAVVCPALLLASLAAVGMVLEAWRVAVVALLPASEAAVAALLPLATPLALPAPTANLPDCWRLPARPARANHQSRCYQRRSSPPQVPNLAPSTSQPALAPACSATTMRGEPSPYPTSHVLVRHGVPPRTGACPAGTTPTCSLPPAASSPANGPNARSPGRPLLPTS